MINIILCDDHIQFLETLLPLVQTACREYLAQDEGYDIGPLFDRGEHLLEYIRLNHVDVLLLDIDMPDMNGFQVAKILNQEYPHIKIVFMSAYDNFVYSTFDYYPFAYLRKEHITEELPGVMKRIADKLREAKQQLSVTTTEGIVRVDVRSILYVESCRNYYEIQTDQGRTLVCRGTLSSFEQNVADYDFFRIHSAFLINLAHVEKLLDNGQVLIRDKTLPIAQKRAQDFRKTYMAYVRRCFNT